MNRILQAMSYIVEEDLCHELHSGGGSCNL
jgi:hypothetical protein